MDWQTRFLRTAGAPQHNALRILANTTLSDHTIAAPNNEKITRARACVCVYSGGGNIPKRKQGYCIWRTFASGLGLCCFFVKPTSSIFHLCKREPTVHTVIQKEGLFSILRSIYMYTHTHTHTHIYIYIYIYPLSLFLSLSPCECACVCVCVCVSECVCVTVCLGVSRSIWCVGWRVLTLKACKTTGTCRSDSSYKNTYLTVVVTFSHLPKQHAIAQPADNMRGIC